MNWFVSIDIFWFLLGFFPLTTLLFLLCKPFFQNLYIVESSFYNKHTHLQIIMLFLAQKEQDWIKREQEDIDDEREKLYRRQIKLNKKIQKVLTKSWNILTINKSLCININLQIFSGLSQIPFDKDQLEYENNMMYNMHTELKMRADELDKIEEEKRSIEYGRVSLNYKQMEFNHEFLEVP